MRYRKDQRSVEQFAKDIKECSKIETQLMKRYVAWLNATKGEGKKIYSFVDNGVNNKGVLLKDEDVDARADFILVKNGAKPRLIDVKFSREPSKKFRIKLTQVKRYLKDDVAIVVFMDLSQPKFCIITPDRMRGWLKEKTTVQFAPWGFKEVYEINVTEVRWYTP